MSASSFDQQAWLDRIRYKGSREPTLGTLHQLIFAHSHTIAYESLDIMLGRTPSLDLASLQRKNDFRRARWLLPRTEHAVSGRSPIAGLRDHEPAGQGRARHGHRFPSSRAPHAGAVR